LLFASGREKIKRKEKLLAIMCLQGRIRGNTMRKYCRMRDKAATEIQGAMIGTKTRQASKKAWELESTKRCLRLGAVFRGSQERLRTKMKRDRAELDQKKKEDAASVIRGFMVGSRARNELDASRSTLRGALNGIRVRSAWRIVEDEINRILNLFEEVGGGRNGRLDQEQLAEVPGIKSWGHN